MKKQKPKELLEKLPFPNFRSKSIFFPVMSEEERTANEADVKIHNDSILQKIENLTFYKLFLLMKHHDIDPYSENRWFILATKLAQQYEPGFQMQEAPSGRTNTWDSNQLLGFYCLIELIKEEREISTYHACKIAKKDHFPNASISIKTLANKYSLAKKDRYAMGFYELAFKIDNKNNSKDARLKTLQDMFDPLII